MKNYIYILATAATLSMSSCHDNYSPATVSQHENEQNTITVTGQSAKSVLTLGFLLANHTELPAGSRATDYGYEYDDDDGVFLTEEEAAAFLAPYTQMGQELRLALLKSYFPDYYTSRSGEGGGVGGDDGGADPWSDPLIVGTLDPIAQGEVEMLYQMTDEEVTEVAIILSAMAYDDLITEVNGCEISMKHTIDCLVGVLIGDEIKDSLLSYFNNWSHSTSGRKLILKVVRKDLIRTLGRLAAKYAPIVSYISLAHDIFEFTNCMLNPELHKIPDDQYEALIQKFEWMTEFDTVELEIIPD